MDIQSILYALEVHNSGSISRAAKNLYVAQPNLSNTIKDLEKELGITLFIRTKNGVTTTEEGMEFLQYARSVATRFEALKNRYQNDNRDSTISISSMRSSEISKRVCNYVNELIDAGEIVNFRYRESNNENVIQDVINNVADIGVIRANANNSSYFKEYCQTYQLVTLPLPTDSYILLMSQDHPLAKESSISIEQLYPYTEVFHGDLEKSWHPELSKVHGIREDAQSPNTFTVYDRSSFLDAVSSIHGAYSFTTTSTHDHLIKYGLIEKNYPGRIMESNEYIILKEASLHNEKLSRLLSALCISSQ